VRTQLLKWTLAAPAGVRSSVYCVVPMFCLLACLSRLAVGAEPGVTISKTPRGVRFGVLRDPPKASAPTLFLFATTIETTLGDANYAEVGRRLLSSGVLVVAIDVPGHGQDRREGEPEGISAWPGRIARDEPLTADFANRCSEVLDHLVAEKRTDLKRVAAAGTSRGGFMAMHFAAADPRVIAVAGFAPLTRPSVLREFASMEKDPRVDALALAAVADRLAGRSVWLTIGNDDARVSTDECIALSRRLVVASLAAKPTAEANAAVVDVQLEVLPSAGHRTPTGAHERAAAWIKERLLGKDVADSIAR